MVTDREAAVNSIFKAMSLTRFEIEQRQAINDLSLNIHIENFLRDILNLVHKSSYRNLNKDKQNFSYIDLIDDETKSVVQVTSTRTKKKLLDSLKIFSDDKYENYDLIMYYLLESPNFPEKTQKEVKSKYPTFDFSTGIKDSKDLMKDINDLETIDLIRIAKLHEGINNYFTEDIILNHVCRELALKAPKRPIHYDDYLGSKVVEDKIVINSLNRRTENYILSSLDFTPIISNIDDKVKEDLREAVIDGFYRDILLDTLKGVMDIEPVKLLNTDILQKLAQNSDIDFDKIIFKLTEVIKDKISISDFNSMNIPWIVVSYFFELCDVGVQSNDLAK